MAQLNVVVIKPSKYGTDGEDASDRRGGYVERFNWGFMPNATIPFLKSMVPTSIGNTTIHVDTADEYVQTDLSYLRGLDAKRNGVPTLLALVGVQSHQFQRALDLAAYAKQRGCMAVIGGPHPITCDTTMLQNRGVSFCLSEAEADSSFQRILEDAVSYGELRPVYGAGRRYCTDEEMESLPVQVAPTPQDLARCIAPLAGLFPARGCPYMCDFCSVTEINGRMVRAQPIPTTIGSLKAAKDAGVRMVMFTSDNFNKIPQVRKLLQEMIDRDVRVPFFAQCDVQIAKDPDLIALMAKAGCFNIFVGAESFDLEILKEAEKNQNDPAAYAVIVSHCRRWGITCQLSNIIGFEKQTEADILNHLRLLKEVDPAMASIYILSPIPGTKQYVDFMKRGLIRERNLDRFDTHQPVWEHPRLSGADRKRLLSRCYREFYTPAHTLRNLQYIKNRPVLRSWNKAAAAMAGYAVFAQWCAFRGIHPMSGGVGRVTLDKAADYLDLRKQTYGYELVPLPARRELSETDQKVNKPGLFRREAALATA